ncbi:MAG: 50S ribosomal protein L18 [Patescibacteria group bacterium]
MNNKKILNKIKERKKKRVRSKIFGTSERPRLSIFKSNRYIYAQLINDDEGKTLCSVFAKQPTTKDKKQLGELIAKKAVEKGIKKAVFDRGNYKYHGRIKEIAEGARKEGLQL